MTERAVQLGSSPPLAGVVTEPDTPIDGERPAVLLLNAGLTHRVGPSRMSVRLARLLAARGHLCVRFDHSGVGDSGLRRDRLTWYEATERETKDTMDALERSEGARRFVLVGLCSGAATAFRVASADLRVVGAVLMNSQGLDGSAAWNDRVLNRGWARHYRRNSLLNLESWKRALTGRSQYRLLLRVLWRSVADRLRPAEGVAEVTSQLSMDLERLVDRGVRLLFVNTAGDHSEDYLEEIAGAGLDRLRASGCWSVKTIRRSDHTFTLLANQSEVLRTIEEWLTETGAKWNRRPT